MHYIIQEMQKSRQKQVSSKGNFRKSPSKTLKKSDTENYNSNSVFGKSRKSPYAGKNGWIEINSFQSNKDVFSNKQSSANDSEIHSSMLKSPERSINDTPVVLRTESPELIESHHNIR